MEQSTEQLVSGYPNTNCGVTECLEIRKLYARDALDVNPSLHTGTLATIPE